MIRLFYSLAGVLMTPALRLWLLKRARRGREVPERLGERFGYASVARPEGKLIWLHAASVGETQSILALVRAVLAEDASVHFLITTGTVTSAALVALAVTWGVSRSREAEQIGRAHV